MKVEHEGDTYKLDVDHIRLKHARVIQRHTGLSIDEWADSLGVQLGEDGSVLKSPPEFLESVAALYWLMLAQNGDETEIDDVDFDVAGFLEVFYTARFAELEALIAAQRKPDPTKPRPPGRKGAPTASRARSSRTATTPQNQDPQEAATPAAGS